MNKCSNDTRGKLGQTMKRRRKIKRFKHDWFDFMIKVSFQISEEDRIIP